MTTREIIHLVGDFQPAVLQRWRDWAELTNRDIRHTTYEELEALDNPIIILCDHGLNDLPLP